MLYRLKDTLATNCSFCAADISTGNCYEDTASGTTLHFCNGCFHTLTISCPLRLAKPFAELPRSIGSKP